MLICNFTFLQYLMIFYIFTVSDDILHFHSIWCYFTFSQYLMIFSIFTVSDDIWSDSQLYYQMFLSLNRSPIWNGTSWSSPRTTLSRTTISWAFVVFSWPSPPPPSTTSVCNVNRRNCPDLPDLSPCRHCRQ